MEISSFFRFSIRRLVAVLVIGGIAAAVAAVVTYRQPAQYQGNATIFTAQVLNPGVPQYSIQPIADNLTSMVFAASAINKAAKATGEAPGQIAGNLQAVDNNTNNVDLQYTSTNAKAIPVVLETVAHQGLKVLGNTALASAEKVLEQAQKDLDKANADLTAHDTNSGTAASPQRQLLVDAVNRATGEIDSANAQINDAQSQLVRSALPSVVAQSGVSQQSRSSDVTRAATTAGVAAAALVLLLMFILDWRQSREDALARDPRSRANRYADDDFLSGPLTDDLSRTR
jgi:hypothetical protein